MDLSHRLKMVALSSAPQSGPPLLITKHLSNFLRANVSAQLTSAILANPAGNLVAYASPIAVRALRTHCAVAASLMGINSTPAPVVDAALSQTTTTGARGDDSAAMGGGEEEGAGEPVCITLSLSEGNTVVVIRRLQCGLLFICMGPAGEAGMQLTQQQQQAGAGGGSAVGSLSETASAAPSTVACGTSSATMGGAGTDTVAAMRRQVEELARWLDDKLGNFQVPNDVMGVGVSG